MTMTAAARYYCERCGNIAFTGAPAGPSYCCGCRHFLCRQCRGTGQLRCDECVSSPPTSRRHKTAGLPMVRRAMSDAEEALTDLANLRRMIDADGDDQGVPTLEWTLTMARIAADFQDAEHGLAGTQRRYRTHAALLRRELDMKQVRVQSVNAVRSAELGKRPPPHVPKWSATPPRRPLVSRPGPAARVMLAILYGVVLIFLVVLWSVANPEGRVRGVAADSVAGALP